MDVYVRQVEIIKQIIINLKRIHYNDNIYECNGHLKVINDDMAHIPLKHLQLTEPLTY